ncbi:14590_t:CDS:2 [Ambispora leptoticha]|uniref:14590_t:CDS:1 n=1 Tax=Ambispora leptoticha TaxID=144679 RepID=A0A9N9C075_9GLOM|nr:14590_t:CDS:2 [Ambispora leptoticha]
MKGAIDKGLVLEVTIIYYHEKYYKYDKDFTQWTNPRCDMPKNALEEIPEELYGEYNRLWG